MQLVVSCVRAIHFCKPHSCLQYPWWQSRLHDLRKRCAADKKGLNPAVWDLVRNLLLVTNAKTWQLENAIWLSLGDSNASLMVSNVVLSTVWSVRSSGVTHETQDHFKTTLERHKGSILKSSCSFCTKSAPETWHDLTSRVTCFV